MPEHAEQRNDRRTFLDDVSTRVRGERLTLTLRHEGDALVVEAFGELDVASAPVLTRAVDDLSPAPAVIFDVSHLSFVDAGGLRALLALTADDAVVVLRHPSRLFRRILEVTDTAAYFRVEP